MAKDIVSAYRNVCRDLQGLEAYLKLTSARLKSAHTVVFKGKMPSSEMCYVPLDRAIVDYNRAVDEHNETVNAIDQLKVTKVQMEQIIGSLSEAEQVVLLMHVEQGISLKEIAEVSSYSYGHLRNVYMRFRKKHVTESANAS